jgi:hypothetical protein
MNKTSALKPCLAVATVLLVLPASLAWSMDHSEYEATKSRIGVDYKTDRVACDSLKANAKDVCVEQAKGKEKIARAELEHSYTGKESDRIALLKARADADYAVAKEQCDDKAGNDKTVCVKEAKAAHTTAQVDARTIKKIHEARVDAADDKRDANYQVAVAKCDALAGAAKDSCIAAAKADFGKS